METRSFGSTGLSVTSIGLGLAALGRPGYINLGHGDDLDGRREVDALRRHTHDVLDAAWDLGIRYFDAARSYGRAEAFLGDWLRARGRAPSDATVGSKWGYTYTADWQVDADVHEVKDHSLSVLQRQWPESYERLGDHIDLYQIHSATLKTGVLEDASVANELARLRHEEGVAIGLSLSGPRQAETLEKALGVRVNGERLFDAVQATWNLLEPSAGAMLQAASEAGLSP
ncbi:MAG: aldo/keto reductase, partial [Bacteroidetes bacterium]|nr:aldo/keto reductase [Bacteroidota bacterium]